MALRSFLLSFLFVLTSLFFLKLVVAAESPPDRQQLLNNLVEGARKEGELVVFGISSLGERGAKVYGETFKTRFGLNNLRFKYSTEGMYGEIFSKAIMETKMGLQPTYDVMNGPDHRGVTLMEVDGVEPIEHWQMLLPEGVNARFASPSTVAGNAFLFATRIKANNYNEKLISYEEMPRTTREVGSQKYKGKFYTSPWPTAAQFGILEYSKEEWIKILKGWGRNKLTTVRSGAGLKRMALGEFAFEPFSNAYYHVQYKERGDPIGLHIFEDITPLSYVFHIVRKDARNPNAAKLFALWATGPEAVQIFEKYSGTGNLYIKESRVGSTVANLVSRKGGKTVSWFDSQENFRILKWYATKEGQAYEDQMSLALGLR